MDVAEIQSKTITRGDTFTELFVFKNEDGEPFDLRVYNEIRSDVRRTGNISTSPVVSLSIGDGITIAGDNYNELIIDISSNVTKEMNSGIYHRDIRFINGDIVKTRLKGNIIIEENITELE